MDADSRCEMCRYKYVYTKNITTTQLAASAEWCRVCIRSGYRLFESKNGIDIAEADTVSKNNSKEVTHIKNFEKHIDKLSELMRNCASCVDCPVYKDGCKVWGSSCEEAFRRWALTDSDEMNMAMQKFVRTAKRVSLDNMRDVLQRKKRMGK